MTTPGLDNIRARLTEYNQPSTEDVRFLLKYIDNMRSDFAVLRTLINNALEEELGS